MTALANHTHRQITAPSSTTREMDRLIGTFSNRLEDFPGDPRRRLISASSAPRGVERQALEDRRAELVASLKPSPGEQANDVIYALIAGFTAYGMSERETDVKVALYADALKTEPTWAIEAARQTFSRGGWHCNWDGNGCPSSASVVAECKYTLLPIETDLHRINLILTAKLVDTDTTQDERDAALAHWAQVRADIVGSNVISERTDDAIQRERDAQQAANRLVRAKEQSIQTSLAHQLREEKEPFEAYERGNAA